MRASEKHWPASATTIGDGRTEIDVPAALATWPLLDGRLQTDSCLTSRDYALLERHWLDVKSRTDSYGVLLARLIRRKLGDARVVLPADIEDDIATGNSCVAFYVEGCPPEVRRLVHWEHEDVFGQTLLVPTLAGVTLLGMKEGQRAPILRADGTVREVELTKVVYQPECARRSGGYGVEVTRTGS